eukprot:m.152339 g.152339  ORF g.152339 m.152339 type:complete len:161 (+) comp38587_c0_seq3:729-1211(+)
MLIVVISFLLLGTVAELTSAFTYCDGSLCSNCCCGSYYYSRYCCNCSSGSSTLVWWAWLLVALGIIVFMAIAIGVGVWRRRVILRNRTIITATVPVATTQAVVTDMKPPPYDAHYPSGGYPQQAYPQQQCPQQQYPQQQYLQQQYQQQQYQQQSFPQQPY